MQHRCKAPPPPAEAHATTHAARDHETACSIVNRSCIHNSTYATTSLPNLRHQTSTPSIQTAQTKLSTYICTNNS